MIQRNVCFSDDLENIHEYFGFIFSENNRYYLDYGYFFSVFMELIDNKIKLDYKKDRVFPFGFVTLLGLVFYKHFGVDIFIYQIYDELNIRNLNYYSRHRVYKHFIIGDEVYSANLIEVDPFIVNYLFKHDIDLFCIARDVEFKKHNELDKVQKHTRKSIYLSSFENLRNKMDLVND
jgi:hypothetical protein